MNGRSEQGLNEGFALGPDRARVNLDSLFTAVDPPHSDTPPCICRGCRPGHWIARNVVIAADPGALDQEQR